MITMYDTIEKIKDILLLNGINVYEANSTYLKIKYSPYLNITNETLKQLNLLLKEEQIPYKFTDISDAPGEYSLLFIEPKNKNNTTHNDKKNNNTNIYNNININAIKLMFFSMLV